MPNLRKTVIVHGRLAMQAERLEMARSRSIGTNILTIEHAAARLAGGFSRPIDPIELRQAVSDVIKGTHLVELEPIKMLPGVPSAVAASLMKLWLAGVDLGGATDHRLRDMAALEEAVMKILPPSAMRPQDMVALALKRIGHAGSCLGAVRIKGMTEMYPIWRPLLIELAKAGSVTWVAGPRETPSWIDGTAINVESNDPHTPVLKVVSCATASHEVVEAIRWVRDLIASGAARADEIAIGAASIADYDDYFNAFAADANIGIHDVRGVKALLTADGQAAAALADIILRGINQKRVRRLIGLSKPKGLSDNWYAPIPRDAAMTDIARWRQVYAGEEAKPDAAILLPLLELVDRGVDAAEDAGETILDGRARQIWRRALETGPVEALDTTVQDLRVDDGLDAISSPIFVPAAQLAAVPRKFVRLIGLSSRGWPRGTTEDALVPDHVVPNAVLNPLPLIEADKRDFRTILATTGGSVTLSYARRDAEGRSLGRSPLVPAKEPVEFLRRSRVPERAMSESDRIFARADEYAQTPSAQAALACWRDWQSDEITAHDGLVRANHPRIVEALGNAQSAKSLVMLLRNPLAYLWTYGVGMKEPDDDSEPLTVDSLTYGNLVHGVLERALGALEADGGVSKATPETIEAAISSAVQAVAADVEAESPIPPKLVWRRTLADVAEVSTAAITAEDEPLIGQRTFVEVPFGGEEPEPGVNYPWDTTKPVIIPGTDIKIRGRMDRVDLSGNGARARVDDYKTGSLPKKPAELVINGGKELQRGLYAFTVKALLGDVEVVARLNYPRAETALPLPDPDATLTKLTGYLVAAKANMAAGKATPGPDSAGDYDSLKFALPANAKAAYYPRKEAGVLEAAGPVAAVWDEK